MNDICINKEVTSKFSVLIIVLLFCVGFMSSTVTVSAEEDNFRFDILPFNGQNDPVGEGEDSWLDNRTVKVGENRVYEIHPYVALPHEVRQVDTRLRLDLGSWLHGTSSKDFDDGMVWGTHTIWASSGDGYTTYNIVDDNAFIRIKEHFDYWNLDSLLKTAHEKISKNDLLKEARASADTGEADGENKVIVFPTEEGDENALTDYKGQIHQSVEVLWMEQHATGGHDSTEKVIWTAKASTPPQAPDVKFKAIFWSYVCGDSFFVDYKMDLVDTWQEPMEGIHNTKPSDPLYTGDLEEKGYGYKEATEQTGWFYVSSSRSKTNQHIREKHSHFEPIYEERVVTVNNWYKNMFTPRNDAVEHWQNLKAMSSIWNKSKFSEGDLGLERIEKINDDLGGALNETGELETLTDRFVDLGDAGGDYDQGYHSEDPGDIIDETIRNYGRFSRDISVTNVRALRNIKEPDIAEPVNENMLPTPPENTWIEVAESNANVIDTKAEETEDDITDAEDKAMVKADNVIVKDFAYSLYILGRTVEGGSDIIIGLPDYDPYDNYYKYYGERFAIPGEKYHSARSLYNNLDIKLNKLHTNIDKTSNVFSSFDRVRYYYTRRDNNPMFDSLDSIAPETESLIQELTGEVGFYKAERLAEESVTLVEDNYIPRGKGVWEDVAPKVKQNIIELNNKYDDDTDSYGYMSSIIAMKYYNKALTAAEEAGWYSLLDNPELDISEQG